MLREHGCQVRYRHDLTGLNSRLDAIQAAVLQIKLPYLDSWNQQRHEAVNYYQQLLQPLSGIQLPQALEGGKSVWNQYTIRVADTGKEAETAREYFRTQLQQKGIMSMVYYPLPLHLQPVYSYLGYRVGQLPAAEQAAREVLSLPLFPGISFEELQQVAYGLKDCLAAK
jgi:dTDP-4-amino-4,6-dideoxygalactose transaminase